MAVRPTFENIIGGFILFADKPVRVGDFCSFGDMMGTVEEIGLRSTRLRALDRTVVTVPNAEFANMQLVNWARCDRMLIQTTIGLRYETKPEQLRYVLAKLREMLLAHPKIDKESMRTRFVGYGASSQDIEIRIYALTRDWNEFYAIQEDVLLRVGEIVEESGTSFAFPSQTLYMGRDQGIDQERSAVTGGIYFGEKTRDADSASDLCLYHRYEIERIVRVAARLAQTRKGNLCSVDKANVLESSRLWRDVCTTIIAEEFDDLNVEHMLVDAAAMHLINRPAEFDVMVTENMFGDILTDEASMLAGSMGMLPSASLGDTKLGLYEPIHGSAPDIAGQGIANPCGMIASVALLLRHSLELQEEAALVESALRQVIVNGARTADLATGDDRVLSTIEMTDAIIQEMH